MPEREAIIDAMAQAIETRQWGAYPFSSAFSSELAAAAYDASPIERYRKALEDISREWLTLDGGSAYQSGCEMHAIAGRALRGDD